MDQNRFPSMTSRKIIPNTDGIGKGISSTRSTFHNRKSSSKEMVFQTNSYDEDVIMEFLKFNESFLI